VTKWASYSALYRFGRLSDVNQSVRHYIILTHTLNNINRSGIVIVGNLLQTGALITTVLI